jgi:hypothetical protein
MKRCWEDAAKAKDLAPPIKGLGCPLALAYSGKFIYVTAATSIFQFDGNAWKEVFKSAARAPVVSVVSDPASPNAIYFAKSAGKVFFKPDQTNGLPWTKDNGGDLQELTGAGLPSSIGKLSLIPNAGKTPNLYAATPLGIFRVANANGNNLVWTRMGVGLPDTPISDLQVNPESRMIYVGTYGRGVWYTLDLQ